MNVKLGGKTSRGFKQRPESILKRTKTRRERNAYPSLAGKFPDDRGKKISIANKGRLFSDEHKKNISIARTGLKASAEARINCSKAQKNKTLEHRINMGRAFSKLSIQQIQDIKEIFSREKISKAKLGRIYNVSAKTIFNAINDRYKYLHYLKENETCQK